MCHYIIDFQWAGDGPSATSEVRELVTRLTSLAQVHKCTFAIYGEKNLKDDIYGMPGVKGQTMGGPGARPSTTDTVCLIWPKGQRSKSGPEPAPH